jgi:hypothetical protein
VDRTSALLIAVAVVLGFAVHGGIQMQAAREAAKQANKYNTVSEGEGGEEERAKHWQRQDALREKELKDIEAQRTWDRSYWNNVLSEAKDLARNRASAGKYQVVRVDGKDVFVLDTATGEVLKKQMPQ